MFGGKTTSLTICKGCGNIVQTDEDFYCLSVNVKNYKTLHESLQQITAGEIISDYKCGACNKKVEISKKLAIKSLPNTLIVHQLRITFDLDLLRNVKVNDRLEFPNTLNLKEYMLDHVLSSSKPAKAKPSQQAKPQIAPSEADQAQVSEQPHPN